MKKMLCLLLCLLLCSSACAVEILEDWDMIARIEGSANLLVCRDELWGMTDETGKVLLEPQFHNRPAFVGDLAAVCKLDRAMAQEISGSEDYADLWGAINRNGEVVIPLEYDEVQLSDDGSMATVQMNREYGFIAADGEVSEKPRYLNAKPFVEGYAAVAIGVEVKGNGDFSEGSVYTAESWGIVDSTGEIVVDCQYDSMQLCGGGLAVASENGRYGCIDMAGKTLIPFEYSELSAFKGDYAVACKSYKYNKSTSFSEPDYYSMGGVIDRSGRVVVPFEYDYIQLEDNGLAKVRLEGKYGLVNMQGQEIVKPEYTRMRSFVGDYVAVCTYNGFNSTGDFWGVLRKDGAAVIPAKYSDIKIFEDNTVRAKTAISTIWFQLDGDTATEISREKNT